jgi:hypothetical protein
MDSTLPSHQSRKISGESYPGRLGNDHGERAAITKYLGTVTEEKPGTRGEVPHQKTSDSFCAVLFYLCFFSYWPTKLVNR